MRTRMKDIADDLGVSAVTVSKVLRNHPDICEETKARVLQRVKELDYQPNVLARSLVTGRSYLVGLIVPDLLHPFFAQVAKALSSVLRVSGYSLIISSSEEDPQLELSEMRQLLARRLDAMVVASVSTSVEQFELMNRKKEPYVLIDRDFPGLSANFVGIDDVAAGRIATEHLISIGCQRVAHMRGRDNSTGIGRFEGYQQALLDHGLPCPEKYIVRGRDVDIGGIEAGADAMRTLLKRTPRPDGVFCYNDPLAMGAIDAILERGLRVPEDIAVIGCGNLHYNRSLRVPLSSVDQHTSEIGQQAAELVLSLIESKEATPARSCILKPNVVIRESTRRPVTKRSQRPKRRAVSAKRRTRIASR